MRECEIAVLHASLKFARLAVYVVVPSHTRYWHCRWRLTYCS